MKETDSKKREKLQLCLESNLQIELFSLQDTPEELLMQLKEQNIPSLTNQSRTLPLKLVHTIHDWQVIILLMKHSIQTCTGKDQLLKNESSPIGGLKTIQMEKK